MTPSPGSDTRRPTGQASPSQPDHAELTGDLSEVVGSLHRTYDERVGATVVETETQQVADRFTGAKVRAFVPLLVWRYAGSLLRAIRPEAPPAPGVVPGAPGRC